ncbi:hypothetical protein ACFQ0G_23475 [Streptomyces chiangmaiensis]
MAVLKLIWLSLTVMDRPSAAMPPATPVVMLPLILLRSMVAVPLPTVATPPPPPSPAVLPITLT